MIILDTDVLSETFKPQPDRRVIGWLNRHRVDDISITSVTLMEVVMGIEVMPEGMKRRTLEHRLLDALRTFLDGRVLTFNDAAAWDAGRLYGARRAKGSTIGVADTQIASIALQHGATLATRNRRHFSDLAVPVVNPWEA